MEAAARKEQMKERTPRVAWAELLSRTFDSRLLCTLPPTPLGPIPLMRGLRALIQILSHEDASDLASEPPSPCPSLPRQK
jgi:hypothetical protein